MTRGMLIVGAGQAGARAATSLREHGWNGAITMVGAEVYRPYERPPLSKAFLTAEEAQALPLILKAQEIKDYGITLHCGSPVTKIDRSRHIVVLHNGAEFAYGRLLIATGSTSRQLDLPGAQPDNVHYLRSFGEALVLRSRLSPGKRLVIVGWFYRPRNRSKCPRSRSRCSPS